MSVAASDPGFVALHVLDRLITMPAAGRRSDSAGASGRESVLMAKGA